MAEIKKYLDTVALGTLVDQIKAEDAKVLAAAKKYTDDAGKLYDVAGAAATAESNAKAYTDELANGAVKANTDAIAKLNGDAQTDGSVAKAIADAKTVIDADVDAVEAKADKNAEDIAAINNAENGVLAQAKAYVDGEVANVQGEVDALEEYIGTFTHETAKTVVEYVDAKTAGIATDAALTELAGKVTQAEADIDAIEADYLKAADKTELEGKITAVETAVATEKSRAEGVEAGLEARIKAVEDDYLVEADKTALQSAIDLKADKTTLEAEVERATAAEEGLQNQINTIMNNPDAEGAINSINEFTKYIADHGEIADGFRTDINKNKEDIAAEVKRAGEAESDLAGRLDVLEAIDHEAYAAADTALKNELNAEIAKKADATALAEAVEALEGADAAQVERIAALEAKFSDGDGNVTDMIATAKQEAIDAAAEDAATKANKALEDAKKYADEEDAKIESRVDALETASATHALASDLTALAGRVTTAEGEIDTLQGDMDAVEAKAAANEGAIDTINTELAKKAAQADLEAAVARVAQNEKDIDALEEASATHALDSDLEAAVERIAANEAAIAANTSAINSFTAITPEEVIALFA